MNIVFLNRQSFLPVYQIVADVEHVVPVDTEEADADVKGWEHLVLDRQQQTLNKIHSHLLTPI